MNGAETLGVLGAQDRATLFRLVTTATEGAAVVNHRNDSRGGRHLPEDS
ncbi:hypothetical protein [Nocardia sp. NBC_00511]